MSKDSLNGTFDNLVCPLCSTSPTIRNYCEVDGYEFLQYACESGCGTYVVITDGEQELGKVQTETELSEENALDFMKADFMTENPAIPR